ALPSSLSLHAALPIYLVDQDELAGSVAEPLGQQGSEPVIPLGHGSGAELHEIVDLCAFFLGHQVLERTVAALPIEIDGAKAGPRSEEHTSELQSRENL